MDFLKTSANMRRHVLIVEDEQINREILGNILSRQYDVTNAENGCEALQVLQRGDKRFSLILLDLRMPEMDGFELLARCKSDESLKPIPVIVITSAREAELESIEMGAADFITKPYDMPEIILARCARIIELSEDKSIIRSTERDALTGLLTGDYFFEYVRQLERIAPASCRDALALNIDHFHLVNEMLGREEGNRVLKTIAQILSEVLVGESGIVCRIGADTFYIYHEHVEHYDDLIRTVNQRVKEITAAAQIRLRTGICQNVDKSAVIETWFDQAKAACDRIREDYTQQLCFYSREQFEEAIYHERLIHDFQQSIEQKHFVVYYQPKYDISGDTPKLCSAEALVRWIHPDLGMISPGDFIPLFESNGLIRKLDNYVWQETAAQIRRWKDSLGVRVPVSVNVSRIDLYDADLESKLMALIDANDLSPDDLMLEITESSYSENAGYMVEVVKKLREKGFRIEMDDFGSGYSSLNMLTSIPIDVLKMDMKFVRNIHKDEKSLRLVELIVDIANFLHVPVIAEGVEDSAQVDTLKRFGCEFVQGFYFSKPVPADGFVRLIGSAQT